ncbi:MAG: CpsD/CapB family tyrosine-protein kinase, partial [Kiritimatiellae bacterium]|nr:CpsD/CapB family tyrosine-protein kinase [Kiritimatiellia bacterium]
LKAHHFTMLRPPRSSSTPVWPDARKILLMVAVIGLGGGVGIALVLQVTDNKIQSIKDVEQVLGIPFLGGVPFWVHSGLEKSIRPIVTEERATGAIEAYRALRTSIVSALQKVNEKIVLVTSADSREGKTLTVLNLAIMMAEMKKKVLLIDMDLRRGRLHRSLGLEREPGVSDVLLEGRSLKDVIKKTRVENLYLAPTGRAVDNSAELLQGSDLVAMLVEVQDDYDYVLMDSSPVLRVTDTVIIATQGLGVVVYVARVNHTPKPLIRYSIDMLGDARILGLIMNSIEMHKISSLYYAYQYPNYAYYSNAYAYGYSYYHHRDETDRDLDSHLRYGPLRRRLHSASRWFRKTFYPL